MNRPEISREALGFPVPIPTLPEVVMDAKVAVPDNAGLAERTTDPVPVEDVTPVPPRATARVPDPAFPMFRDVTPEPSPVRVVALTVAAVTVPVNVGLAERTLLPVPVEVVVPVPPRATARVPDPAFPMFRDVTPEPSPVKVEALTVLDPAMAP